MTIREWLRIWVSGKPHLVIGGEKPYMLRWHVLPRNKYFNVYLHRIVRDDDDRALHDHPWHSLSIILSGGYWEVVPPLVRRWCGPGSMRYRRPEYQHRLELDPHARRGTWTLFVTGPKLREWGFWCPKGFVPWHEFVAGDDRGSVGKGCGE